MDDVAAIIACGAQNRAHRIAAERRQNRQARFDDPEWAWVGERRMFVGGHTPGGAPFGCFEDELEDLGSSAARRCRAAVSPG